MNSGAWDWQSGASWIMVAIAVALVSFLACWLAMKLAQRSGMIALPGERQSHLKATPTGGGLGMIITMLIISLVIQHFQDLPVYWWLNMLPGIVLLALVGWLDDKRPVSATIRLLVQFTVSLYLLLCMRFLGPAINAGMIGITVIAMVWLMNLYNFMDGSNGMAGFQGLFCSLVFAVLFQLGGHSSMAMIALVVAAACIGFLPLNFPVAKVFMGDVASVPLGFIFAAFSVYGIYQGIFAFWAAVLIMSVFLVDASLTLAARVIQREQWYTAHKQHVYQRLIEQEWSHSQVLIAYQAINVVMVLPAIVLVTMYPQYAIVTTLLMLLVLSGGWYIANWKLGAHSVRRSK
jgi:Fuc2NAc and GlcNAc transferase